MQSSYNFLTAHLKAVDESYSQHFLHAGYYFAMLLAAAICALIHAVLPFLFENMSSRIILNLHAKMTSRKLFET